MSTQDTARKPIAWLVNEGGHATYKKAERWGRLMPLTAGSVNPFSTDRLIVNLSQRLAMAQEQDYLVISGVAILNALAIAIMLAKFEKVQLLQWSTKKASYVKLVLHRANIEVHAKHPLGPAE